MRKKNKQLTKKVLILSLVGMFTFTSGIVFAKSKTYDGVASPISTVTINMGFNDMDRGFVTFTPMPGTFFRGPIFDTNGKIIRQGDLLIALDKSYRIADVNNAKANIEKDLALLHEKKEVYLRDKKLIGSHSVSVQEYQNAQSDYFQAKAQLEADKATLILKERILSFCDYYARFDGIVEEVMFSAGYTGGEIPIMKVSQLYPMGIDIKIPREEARKLTVETPVTVYPVDRKEPVGVFNGYSTLTKDGIKVLVNNYPKEDLFKEIDGKKYNIIHSTDTVMPFDFLNQDSPVAKLAIPTRSVATDAKGDYVLKAIGQKNGVPGKGIKPLLKLKKVNIILGSEITKITPSVDNIELSNSGTLKPGDLVLNASDINNLNLKDGDSVYYCYERTKYLFMPGDPVKVVIGE
jgi:hypothetical protein